MMSMTIKVMKAKKHPPVAIYIYVLQLPVPQFVLASRYLSTVRKAICVLEDELDNLNCKGGDLNRFTFDRRCWFHFETKASLSSLFCLFALSTRYQKKGELMPGPFQIPA